VVSYAKRHLVPLVERQFRAGAQDAAVDVDGRQLAIAICKDLEAWNLEPRDIEGPQP
jgi:predicted amidohydrolase